MRTITTASTLSALAIAGGVLSLIPLVDAAATDSVTVSGLPLHVEPGAAGIGQAAPEALGEVTLHGLPLSTRLLLTLTPTLGTLLAVAGLLLLIRVLTRISSGRPFHRDTVRDLRIIGLLLLVWAAVMPGLNMLLTMVALADRSSDVSFSTTYSLLPLIACITAFLVAQAFERGRQLEDDVEGLV